jgi:hypothetical protein
MFRSVARIARFGSINAHPELCFSLPRVTPLLLLLLLPLLPAQRASIDDNGDDINRALRARALLLQDLQQPVLLEDLVVKLYALEVHPPLPPYFHWYRSLAAGSLLHRNPRDHA